MTKSVANGTLSDSNCFRLEALADGVYAALSGGPLTNAGMVDLGEEVLIFDAFMSPQAARDLLAAADHLIGKPVMLLVNSHYHADHVLGNYVFPISTTIVSTHPTRELIIERMPGYIEMLKGEIPPYVSELRKQHNEAQDAAARQGLATRLAIYSSLAEAFDELVVRPPDFTFEGQLVLHGSKRAVQLLSYGGGSTDGDAILYLPDDRIVFMGDMLMVQTHPFLSDSTPDVWISALEEAITLDVAVAVPGHGPVGGKEDIDALRGYLTAVDQLAREVVANGGSVEDAVKVPMPSEYVGWMASGGFANNMRFLVGRLSESQEGK